MTERRTNDRQRVLKAAKIVWNKGSSVLDCTMRNISKSGAMVEVVNTLSVPDEFELRWDDNAQRQQCIVVWRKLSRLSVKFANGPPRGVS